MTNKWKNHGIFTAGRNHFLSVKYALVTYINFFNKIRKRKER